MTTSPALPEAVTPPTTRPGALSTLSGLRRRVPTILLFATNSFTGWMVDYVLALVLNSLTGSVLYAVVGARVVSCTLGFLLNWRLFRAAPEIFWRSAGGYAAVQGGVAAASYAGTAVLTGAGVPLWLAKILVDSTLFIVNYLAQSRLVYRSPSSAARGTAVPVLAQAA